MFLGVIMNGVDDCRNDYEWFDYEWGGARYNGCPPGGSQLFRVSIHQDQTSTMPA